MLLEQKLIFILSKIKSEMERANENNQDKVNVAKAMMLYEKRLLKSSEDQIDALIRVNNYDFYTTKEKQYA